MEIPTDTPTEFELGDAERQNWIQDKFNSLKTHIRKTFLSKSSGFKSPQRGGSESAASAYNISRASTDTVWRPASTLGQHSSRQSSALPVLVFQPSSVDQQVMYKFGQIKTPENRLLLSVSVLL